MEMRDDDAFWAARRVMAFSDDLIRAVVKTGEIGDEAQEKYLADTLILRRDKIGRAYLPKINPIVDPVLSATGELTFGNAAVQYGFAPAPTTYTATWGRFDNATGTSTRVGQTSGSQLRLQAPADLPTTAGTFIEVELSAQHPTYPSWGRPIKLHFKRDGGAWTLVGLQRLPPREPGPATH